MSVKNWKRVTETWRSPCCRCCWLVRVYSVTTTKSVVRQCHCGKWYRLSEKVEWNGARNILFRVTELIP